MQQDNTCSISMENNRTRPASTSRYRSGSARTGETTQRDIGCRRLYSFSSFSFSPIGKEYLADATIAATRVNQGSVPGEITAPRALTVHFKLRFFSNKRQVGQ